MNPDRRRLETLARKGDRGALAELRAESARRGCPWGSLQGCRSRIYACLFRALEGARSAFRAIALQPDSRVSSRRSDSDVLDAVDAFEDARAELSGVIWFVFDSGTELESKTHSPRAEVSLAARAEEIPSLLARLLWRHAESVTRSKASATGRISSDQAAVKRSYIEVALGILTKASEAQPGAEAELLGRLTELVDYIADARHTLVEQLWAAHGSIEGDLSWQAWRHGRVQGVLPTLLDALHCLRFDRYPLSRWDRPRLVPVVRGACLEPRSMQGWYGALSFPCDEVARTWIDVARHRSETAGMLPDLLAGESEPRAIELLMSQVKGLALPRDEPAVVVRLFEREARAHLPCHVFEVLEGSQA